jgi:diguanylate cyclase (GGDEF)-like protein
MKQYKINRLFLTLITLAIIVVSFAILSQFTSFEWIDYLVVFALSLIGIISVRSYTMTGLLLAFVTTLLYGLVVIFSGTTDIMSAVEINYYYLGLPITLAVIFGFIGMINQVLKEDIEVFSKEYDELVRIDDLTGFRNQVDYYVQLDEEINRKNRYKHDLTLMLLYIESFDDLNELYGEHQGNKLLKYLSEFVVEVTRNVDKHYRVASNLFAVILPNTSHEGSIILRERFIEALEEVTIVVKTNNQRIDIEMDIIVEEYKDESLTAREFHHLAMDKLSLQKQGD